MVKGVCPTCQKELGDNVFVTRESEIFKGHNVYVMCKGCGLIMMYNEAREALFSLDRFKEDEDVINEIKTYLSELLETKEQELEKVEEPKPEPERKVLLEAKEPEPVEEHNCDGNCASCTIDCEAKEITEFYEIPEEIEEKEPVNLEGVLYMVHRKTDERRFISADDLHLIKDLEEWMFYEFQPVLIEPVVSYKIHRL
jgi:RNase P subunit RPR2